MKNCNENMLLTTNICKFQYFGGFGHTNWGQFLYQSNNVTPVTIGWGPGLSVMSIRFGEKTWASWSCTHNQLLY